MPLPIAAAHSMPRCARDAWPLPLELIRPTVVEKVCEAGERWKNFIRYQPPGCGGLLAVKQDEGLGLELHPLTHRANEPAQRPPTPDSIGGKEGRIKSNTRP